MADNNTPLLKVEHLHKEFPTGSGFMGGKFSKKVVKYLLRRPLKPAPCLASSFAIS